MLANELRGAKNFEFVRFYKQGINLKQYRFECSNSVKNQMTEYTYVRGLESVNLDNVDCFAVFDKNRDCVLALVNVTVEGVTSSHIVDLTLEEKKVLSSSFKHQERTFTPKKYILE